MSRVSRWAALGVVAISTWLPVTAAAEPVNRDGELAAKGDLYLQLSTQTLDSHGWLADTHCDGLLYSGLYAAVGGPAQIEGAEDQAAAAGAGTPSSFAAATFANTSSASAGREVSGTHHGSLPGGSCP